MPRPFSSVGQMRHISQRRSSVAVAACVACAVCATCAAVVGALPASLAAQALPAARTTASASPAPRVRVRVLRSAESTSERAVLLVQVESEGVRLGSYQGLLRFDPLTFAVDSCTAGRDGTRMVNAAEAARGVIRFAGFATTGFTSDVAVRLVARVPRSASDERLGASLEARLEIAGDLGGKPLPTSALVSSSGLAKQP